MAAAIEKKYSVSSELVRLSDGIFNVYVDGQKIFDKKAVGRFPEEDEVLDNIAQIQS